MAADARFTGAWRLVSFEYLRPDGSAYLPFGPNPVGYIMYSPDGYMMSAIMDPRRPKFGNISRFWEGEAALKVTAADGYASYSGPYEVRGDAVYHKVQVALFPNWVGVDQVRYFKFEGDRLILRTPRFQLDGVEHYGIVVWEKAEAQG
jgi:hypothetical protein